MIGISYLSFNNQLLNYPQISNIKFYQKITQYVYTPISNLLKFIKIPYQINIHQHCNFQEDQPKFHIYQFLIILSQNQGMSKKRLTNLKLYKRRIFEQFDDQNHFLCLSNVQMKIGEAKCITQIKSKLQNMEILYLSFCNINNEKLKIICRGLWPKLKFLDLSENTITDNGIDYLAQTNWNELQRLRLYFNNISSKGFFSLLKIKQQKFKQLKELNISDNPIGSEGIKFLIRTSWQNLEGINIDRCKLGNEGAKNLSKGHWPSLRELTLNGNSINQQGMKELWKLKLPQLKIFSLCDNPTMAFGVIQFYGKLAMPKVEDITINYEQVIPACREMVKGIFGPDVEMQFENAQYGELSEDNEGDQDNGQNQWEDVSEQGQQEDP